jgi:anti-sigma regulatory factor (Ser/Thr protein kinase)
VTHSRNFECRPDSVPAARRFVREVLRGLPREVVDAAELMTSELTTNSVRHAHSGFELAVRLQGRIRIEVRDCGAGRPTRLSPTPQDPSGRGLRIVETMADAWGFCPSPSGKTVWFTLARPGAGAREPSRA